MIKNTGNIDRVIRGGIAVLLAVLFATGGIGGQWVFAIAVVAAIMLITALAGFCPLYWVLGINTCKRRVKS